MTVGLKPLLVAALSLIIWTGAHAQTVSGPAAEEIGAPGAVDISPEATDFEIDARLTGILEATGWFADVAVSVRNGVVFLDGQTETDRRMAWAAELARNTEDVAAVVNRIEVATRIWDFSPAHAELQRLWRSGIRAVPVVLFSAAVLLVSWVLATFIARQAGGWLAGRTASPLLTRMLAGGLAGSIFLVGALVVLQVAGLTQIALTLAGGTGVAGIVVGFAFRDIAENFLASILLSMRRPFLTNDIIEVAGYRGLVHQMNTRSTILMTSNGNHIQIPNATIFKSTIVNLTANNRTRAEIEFSIGYDHSISRAQEIVHDVLEEHPAVLDDPAPWVLVESLGASSIVMRAYFWFDFGRYSEPKVRSALLRQLLRALEAGGISAPDEAREIIFPQGVPILTGTAAVAAGPAAAPVADVSADAAEDRMSASEEEGGLASETTVLQEQADTARSPEEGRNLLDPPASKLTGTP